MKQAWRKDLTHLEDVTNRSLSPLFQDHGMDIVGARLLLQTPRRNAAKRRNLPNAELAREMNRQHFSVV